MKGLIWFRHDLRLNDNPAIVALSRRCDKALFVYVIDPEWFKQDRFQSQRMGKFRQEFLLQTLQSLQRELRKYRQKLVVKVGNPLTIIPNLCAKHGIDMISVSDHPGVYERQQVAYLSRVLSCDINVSDSFTLYLQSQLLFDKRSFPATFNQFKKNIFKRNILPCIPISAPDSLPSMLKEPEDAWRAEKVIHEIKPYQGGEDPALQQIEHYFWKSDGLKKYKETRNFLDGWKYSSKFSAWMANGALSVRCVAAELDKFEYRYGRNASTEAMFSELLWREYFQWMLHHYGTRLFAFDGIKRTRPLTTFYAERYKAWEQGTTAYPLVNACMRQLNSTGYISNRSRQIVASCLINELGLDWRYGAAYFEQQLIDFDVGINYGNWQYLAGVGADPRSQRHFNLEKQTQAYDPDGKFVEKWVNPSKSISLL